MATVRSSTETLPLLPRPLHEGIVDPETRPGGMTPLPVHHSPAPQPRRSPILDALADGARLSLVPAAAAGAVAALEHDQPVHCALLAAIAFSGGALLARRGADEAARLPLMRSLYPMVAPGFGVLAMLALMLASGTQTPSLLPLVGAFAIATLVGALGGATSARAASARGPLRVALIGGARSADPFSLALPRGSRGRYTLVGCVGTGHDGGAVPVLGELDDLSRLVVEHRIDVLVLAADAPRLEVFEEVARSCLDLPVRLIELSELYEQIFGYVPAASINAEWFACLAHPSVGDPVGPAKRALDLLVATLLGLVALPVLGLLALLVRRDGGPALFSQIRIGEGGRPFRVYKLRSMTPSAGTGAQWAQLDDPRITPIGRFLRASHLDELPQLYNVMRGEMSIVGPRPEQPEFVVRLERNLPYYQRRHMMRPGITGWAQIRCGYAGSDVGSAWKLCHDLYYIKHRSLGLDLLILFETLATLVLPREPVMEPENAAFILGDAS